MLIITAIGSSLALRKASNAEGKAADAKSTATDAQQASAVAKAVTDVNTQRISNVSNQQAATAGRVTDLAASMPATNIAPPTPTPEAIAQRMQEQS